MSHAILDSFVHLPGKIHVIHTLGTMCNLSLGVWETFFSVWLLTLGI
jgi:hypothetical protein